MCVCVYLGKGAKRKLIKIFLSKRHVEWVRVRVCVYVSGRLWTLFTIISKSVGSSNKINTRSICHTHLSTKPPTRNRWQGKNSWGKWISNKKRYTGIGVYRIHTHTDAYLHMLINNSNFKFKHALQTFNQVLNGNAEGQLEWIQRHSIAKTQTTTHCNWLQHVESRRAP